MSEHKPIYWPDDLALPGSPGWERKAIAWLLDRCPSEFRSYPAFRQQPAVLSMVALDQIAADVEAIRTSYRKARTELSLSGVDIDEVMTALDKEGVRLVLELRSAETVCRYLAKTSAESTLA